MHDADQVIVKRLPITEVVSAEGQTRHTIPCNCVDDIFHEADPSCDVCSGSGAVEIGEPEFTVRESGEKKVWVTRAKIMHDSDDAIYDEDDDGGNIHAFFSPDDDVREGDYVIPSGQQVTYVVCSIQDVRSIDNTIMRDCSLEPA